jgi:hypothetical protein
VDGRFREFISDLEVGRLRHPSGAIEAWLTAAVVS